MWFSTQDGLNVFDGYETKVYMPAPFDSTSLSSGWAWDVGESRDGTFWIGTEQGGLNELDRGSGKFRRYRHDALDSTTIISDRVFDTVEDADGFIWVATADGISKLDRTTGKFVFHLVHRHEDGEEHHDADSTMIPAGNVYTLRVDADNTIWAGTDNGLVELDPVSGEFRNYVTGLNEGLAREQVVGRPSRIFRVSEFAQDPGIMWIGTGKGFIRFDKATAAYERFVPDESAVGTEFQVIEVAQDPNEDHILWVATSGKGLARFNKLTKTFQRYRRNRADPNGLVHDDINSLVTDRAGQIWVGTQFGLSHFNPASLDFVNVDTTPQGFDVPDPTTPWGIMADRSGSLWIGSNDAGSRQFLTRLDTYTGETKVWESSPNDLTGAGRGSMWGQHQDPDGTIWVGSAGLLAKYDERRDTWKQWRWSQADPESIPARLIKSVKDVKGEPDKLWLGTSGGFYQFDKVSGKTRELRMPADTLSPAGFVLHVTYDLDENLWVLTGDIGVFRMNDDETFTQFTHNPRDTTTLVTNFVMGFAQRQSEPGIIWFATGNGIDRFDIATGKVTDHLNTSTGLPNEVVYGILVDDQERLWFSTNNGIGRYDPASDEYRNFGLDSGLRQLEYMQHSWAKGPDGTMYFGHIEGITAFHPDRLRHNPVPPDVAFNDFKVHNQSVAPGPGSPLRKPLDQVQTIELPASQNVFSFDFVGLHYGNPKENEYAYKLDGWDEDWNYVGHLRTASYTNLPAGKYTFRVKAANADGVWNEDGKAINLVIHPPWWKAWWAYLSYLLLAALGVFAVDRLQRRRMSIKERERAHILEAQLKADAQTKRRQDAERMSEIGRAITSTLSVHGIIDTVYENVNALMDASVFGVGVYSERTQRIHFPASKEQGETLPAFFHDATDMNRLSALCLAKREDIVIGDYRNEYSKYVSLDLPPVQGEAPDSIVYLPLIHQDKPIGVVTAQSFQKNAYSDYHISVLKSLASYAAIALDNADAYRQLGSTVENLKAAQARLVQSEKMASLGEMTAGIAHEIKNPLNFVNNFAELNLELADELAEELGSRADLAPLLADMKSNAAQIARHGKRADSIVRAMMQHASGGAGESEPVDVNSLVEEYVGLAYHGARASDQDFNVTIEKDFDEAAGVVPVVPQEIGRVLLNLLGNAFYVVHERAAKEQDESYAPTVSVSTRRMEDRLELRVADNGLGIPDEVKDRIFEPFFTTKPTGSGTGLGLSLSYEIVTSGHGGEMRVESEPGAGATFIISLPLEAAVVVE
jgi:signal transduction histidine kinase/ligand-binding sensor domain-containing protein